MKKLSLSLWFNNNLEEAIEYYKNVFGDELEIVDEQKYTEVGKEHHGHEPGELLLIIFRLKNLEIELINGDDQFKFNQSASISVHCDDQEEIDKYWDGLTEGVSEREIMCGWLTDRYGVTWQIFPYNLNEIFATYPNAMKNMFEMKKFIIEDLKK